MTVTATSVLGEDPDKFVGTGRPLLQNALRHFTSGFILGQHLRVVFKKCAKKHTQHEGYDHHPNVLSRKTNQIVLASDLNSRSKTENHLHSWSIGQPAMLLKIPEWLLSQNHQSVAPYLYDQLLSPRVNYLMQETKTRFMACELYLTMLGRDML